MHNISFNIHKELKDNLLSRLSTTLENQIYYLARSRIYTGLGIDAFEHIRKCNFQIGNQLENELDEK